MKRKFLIGLILTIALVFSSSSCSQKTESNRNSNRANSQGNENAANHGEMNHNQMNPNAANSNQAPANHEEINHTEMQTAPDAKNAPFDLQFLDTMIAHHQGAVVMAKPAVEKAQH